MDQSGAIVPGAVLEVKRISNGVSHTISANGIGEIQIELPPGNYLLTASHFGFKQYHETLSVRPGSSADLKIVLSIDPINPAPGPEAPCLVTDPPTSCPPDESDRPQADFQFVDKPIALQFHPR